LLEPAIGKESDMPAADRTRSLTGLLLIAVGLVLAVVAIDLDGTLAAVGLALGGTEVAVGLGLVLKVALSGEVEAETCCPACGQHTSA
jgi:hypothetical protein